MSLRDTKKMQFVKIVLDQNTLEWIDRMDKIYSSALSVWIRAFIILKENGGIMPAKQLIIPLTKKRRGIKLIKTILEASGDMIFEDKEVYFSNDAFNRFNIIIDPVSRKNNDAKTLDNDAKTQDNDAKTQNNGAKTHDNGAKTESNLPSDLNSNAHARIVKDIIENKENRELENKEGGNIRVSRLLTLATHPQEIKFYEYMLANYPNVCNMRDILTWDHFVKLRGKGYSQELIFGKLDDMENLPRLKQRYVSAYLTLSSWLRLEMQRRERRTGQSSG